MPTASNAFLGEPIVCNLVRKEDDTDDINVHLSNADGTDADVIGWSAILDVSLTKNGSPVAGGTFTGIGIAGGNIPIDMNSFALAAPVNYYYDIRITDTVTSDTPARVYFTGRFKVLDRVKI